MKKFSIVAAVIIGCFLGTVISNLVITPQIANGRTVAKPGVIKASRFELVDNNGNKRASLELEDGDKMAAIYLWDSNETPLVVLKASQDGSALMMKTKGKLALGVVVDNKQGSLLSMSDPITGKPGIHMSATNDGPLAIIYKDGVPREVKTAE